jgi:hypothetical protein
VQAWRTAAQQLLGQFSPDLDPYPANLIIIVGDLVDPVRH